MVFPRRTRSPRWVTRIYFEEPDNAWEEDGWEEDGWEGEERHRRGLPRVWSRAGMLPLGVALSIAGAVLVVHAVTQGPLTGGGAEIPAAVGTSVPQPGAAIAPLAASAPVRIEIPALDVSAPVIQLGQAANGAVEVPALANHNLAGWYDRTVTPGQEGASVILGHVDSFTGASVFFRLKTLRPGNQVMVVRANGSTATFTVDGVQKVAKAGFPSSIIYGEARYPSLRLITCGGPFDATTRQYLDNIVVYSHLTASAS